MVARHRSCVPLSGPVLGVSRAGACRSPRYCVRPRRGVRVLYGSDFNSIYLFISLSRLPLPRRQNVVVFIKLVYKDKKKEKKKKKRNRKIKPLGIRVVALSCPEKRAPPMYTTTDPTWETSSSPSSWSSSSQPPPPPRSPAKRPVWTSLTARENREGK